MDKEKNLDKDQSQDKDEELESLKWMHLSIQVLNISDKLNEFAVAHANQDIANKLIAIQNEVVSIFGGFEKGEKIKDGKQWKLIAHKLMNIIFKTASLLGEHNLNYLECLRPVDRVLFVMIQNYYFKKSDLLETLLTQMAQVKPGETSGKFEIQFVPSKNDRNLLEIIGSNALKSLKKDTSDEKEEKNKEIIN